MSVVTATIIGESGRMDSQWELLSVDITYEVNRIPSAQLVLRDGNVAKQKFLISNTAFFEPGKKIEIKLRYEGGPGKEESVFIGLVVKHAVEGSAQGATLTIDMKDAAIKMTRTRKSCVYHGKTDGEILRALIKKSDLIPRVIADTKYKHKEIVQYNCSNWDFMLARAEANGMLIVTEAGKISLQEIKVDGNEKKDHVFNIGIDSIYNFEIEVDGSDQYAEVQTLAWDVKEQTISAPITAKNFTLKQGNLDAAKIAKQLGGEVQILSNIVPQENAALHAWADGTLKRSRIAMIRGRISVPGISDIHCLDSVKISGVGDRVNGKTLVTGIRHRVDEHGWQTDVQFGCSSELFTQKPNVVDLPAAGQLPGINGLQIGLVEGYDDPEKQYRVQVLLPGIDGQNEDGADKRKIWARLSTPDAGKGRGYFFRPEPGDEVIVGFFNDDPRQAVILGAMYSEKNSMPKAITPNSKNNENKGIVTRSGITMKFIDGPGAMDNSTSSFSIETPKKQKIIFDDSGEVITISDKHMNMITMNKQGIKIMSAADLTINAMGNITFNSEKNVEITGKEVNVK